MSVKKILSDAASIIKLFIILLLVLTNSKADDANIKHYSEDMGTLSLMYHRFNENKYPSTNIRMNVFKDQLEIIKKSKLKFYNPDEFSKNFKFSKKEKKILITIDDAFLSFYENAWPLLKKNKIPFILFVSTEPVGKNGYMNWQQI
ncbi:polysaccharide deacetylase family protein, partial [Candidatus Pelagibacter sp.]|nr:polysaccharide deacetylase family protein [Candidatus Pelagibacter sp.]